MKNKTSFNVLIDNVKNTLQLQYNTGSNAFQYNTKGNKSAHTFAANLNHYPINTPIKTNGHTYIILE